MERLGCRIRSTSLLPSGATTPTERDGLHRFVEDGHERARVAGAMIEVYRDPILRFGPARHVEPVRRFGANGCESRLNLSARPLIRLGRVEPPVALGQ